MNTDATIGIERTFVHKAKPILYCFHNNNTNYKINMSFKIIYNLI